MKKILLTSLFTTLIVAAVAAQAEKGLKVNAAEKKRSASIKLTEAQRKALKEANFKQQGVQSNQIQKATLTN